MASSAPPPLKKRRRDEQPPGLDLGPPALDLSAIEAAEATSQKRDDDPTEGEWLFKQDDVVLGPVAAPILVQRIEKGELSADTPVGREAGKWKPLKSVGYFKEVLDKAESRKKAIQEQLEREARRRKQRVVRWSTLVSLAVGPFLVGAVAGGAVMVARPWDKTDEWLQQAPPLVDLPPRPKQAEPPPSADDKDKEPAGGDDDGDAEAKADDKDGDKDGDKREGKRKKRDKRVADSGKKADGAGAVEEPKGAQTKAESGGGGGGPEVLETLTQQQVMTGLAAGKGPIGACLKAEVARNPEMPNRVTLMFTITEAGKAINFKVKEREVREGPMAKCLSDAVAKLSWPKFRGERKNVELPLSVKK